MGMNTAIEWCDHTFNPVWGCSKVSEGCQACYAEAFAHRHGTEWGVDAERRTFGEAHWNQPYRWDGRVVRKGLPPARVFCGSMCDIFEDHPIVREELRNLMEVIQTTPSLRWLLLTKRAKEMVESWQDRHDINLKEFGEIAGWYDEYYPNVWQGVTVENQRRADERCPLLLQLKDCATLGIKVRWLSVEPLLEEVDLSPWLGLDKINWVIVGGESKQPKHQPRRFEIEWCESVVEQCRRAKIPVFVKQMGDNVTCSGELVQLGKKGKQVDLWPEHLRIRQIPAL